MRRLLLLLCVSIRAKSAAFLIPSPADECESLLTRPAFVYNATLESDGCQLVCVILLRHAEYLDESEILLQDRTGSCIDDQHVSSTSVFTEEKTNGVVKCCSQGTCIKCDFIDVTIWFGNAVILGADPLWTSRSDAYLRISHHGQLHRTSVQPNQYAPFFNETMVISRVSKSDILTIEAMDQDTWIDDLVGKTYLHPIQDCSFQMYSPLIKFPLIGNKDDYIMVRCMWHSVP